MFANGNSLSVGMCNCLNLFYQGFGRDTAFSMGSMVCFFYAILYLQLSYRQWIILMFNTTPLGSLVRTPICSELMCSYYVNEAYLSRTKRYKRIDIDIMLM